MTVTLQTSPYLREQRQFPASDAKTLASECDQAYIDIALKVNARTVGLFSIDFPVVTGEAWFFAGSSQRQQTLRQVYKFTAAGSIVHGINFSAVSNFTRIYGTIFDGTNYYPLPYVNTVAVNNQISVNVTPTNIVITAGGGGGQPAIVSGLVIIEWLSQY